MYKAPPTIPMTMDAQDITTEHPAAKKNAMVRNQRTGKAHQCRKGAPVIATSPDKQPFIAY